MRHPVAGLISAAALLLLAAGLTGTVVAQTPSQSMPGAAASPSPSPSPAARRLRVSIDSYTSAINQQMVGPGITPPEGAGFAAGGVVAPGTPYDLFSGDPLITGMAIHQALELIPTYAISSAFDLSLTAGYGTVGGSGNVANYWGDSIMPTLNPTLGSRAFSDPVAFPTHNGVDGVQGSRVSILDGMLALHNGDGGLTVGWLDQHQSVRFVFAQPAWTNTPAELVPILPENIGEPSPGTNLEASRVPILPLQGIDAWYTEGLATAEVTDGDLPAVPGTSARVSSVSLSIAHGAQLVYSGEIARLTQSGTDTTAPVLFGTLPVTNASGQGPIPQSTLFAQKMLVAGASAVFPVGTSDAEARFGYSCYTAYGAFAPTSSCTSGTYAYGKFHHGFNTFDGALELVYFAPTYAPAILPYGTEQNILDAQYAWPRTWFPEDYAFVDHSIVGANRQGARLSLNTLVAGVEVRLAGGIYEQIQSDDAAHAYDVGFNEPYFTPQLTSSGGTLGWEHHLDAAFAWHPAFGNVRLDLSDSAINRAPSFANPSEAVEMDYPGAVLALTRPITSRITGSVGAGRYAAHGAFDSMGPNVDLAEGVLFAGAEYQANASTAYHLQYRLYSEHGTTPETFGPSIGAFHGPQIMFEELFKT